MLQRTVLQYCIGTWNIRSMNQGKLGMVKQEMVRINIDILGIRKLKCMEMGEFNARLHHYADQELPDVQEGFRKGRGARDQIVNICWIIEKARQFQKKHLFLFHRLLKVFYCVDHDKLWEALREMGIPDNLTCLLRNLFASQEATVRTLYGTTGSRWNMTGQSVFTLFCSV